MNDVNVIEVRNIKKTFKVYYDKSFELKERLLFRSRNKFERREVLKGITFDIKRGEAIGLIGKNGCGKSTTLKIINRIMYPDSGSVRVKGRVSSLLELGAGFHPDMSGRENIYTNAAIFGLNKKEIDNRLEQIITFSELEKYIDNPVRTYSSGMYMRLAFSVAINVDADILLIDEILGVGDVSFQKKCFDKLLEIKERGTTIVIVSHSLEQVEEICDRSIWIEDGFIRESGVPREIHNNYRQSMEVSRQERIVAETEKNIVVEEVKEELPFFCGPNARRYGNKKMVFENICLTDESSVAKEQFTKNDNLVISYAIDTKGLNERLNIAFRLIREDGIICFASDYTTKKFVNTGEVSFLESGENQKGKIIIKTSNFLGQGSYYIDLVVSREGVEVYDEICRIKDFKIEGISEGIGMCDFETIWIKGE